MTTPASLLTAPVRLLIVDDHPVVCEGIRGMFAGDARFIVVGMAATGEQAVQAALTHAPDVVLMDLRLPDMDGITAMRQIRAAGPQIRVLVLTSYDAEQDIREAFAAGAGGYLLKDTPREDLYAALFAVLAGKPVFSPGISRLIIEQWQSPRTEPSITLTEREIAVLTLVAQGMTSKAIGAALHISEATVKTHLKHIYNRLDVPDRAAAVAVALKRNLIRLD